MFMDSDGVYEVMKVLAFMITVMLQYIYAISAKRINSKTSAGIISTQKGLLSISHGDGQRVDLRPRRSLFQRQCRVPCMQK